MSEIKPNSYAMYQGQSWYVAALQGDNAVIVRFQTQLTVPCNKLTPLCNHATANELPEQPEKTIAQLRKRIDELNAELWNHTTLIGDLKVMAVMYSVTLAVKALEHNDASFAIRLPGISSDQQFLGLLLAVAAMCDGDAEGAQRRDALLGGLFKELLAEEKPSCVTQDQSRSDATKSGTESQTLNSESQTWAVR